LNTNGTKPIDHKLIDKYLYRAFGCIGISDVERRDRNVTFHSWRHAFDTYTRPNVKDWNSPETEATVFSRKKPMIQYSNLFSGRKEQQH
jgi:hypothetical protein